MHRWLCVLATTLATALATATYVACWPRWWAVPADLAVRCLLGDTACPPGL